MDSGKTKKLIIFLVGPTAIGKSEIALGLAKKLKLEIISCDSMQIYKDMDIITSKPTLAMRKEVKHHLIDFVKPDKTYDVFSFRKEAVKKIKEVLARRKTPLLVGGTGLYMSILVDGIFKVKADYKAIRNKLYEKAKQLGGKGLHNRLMEVDRDAALKIHPNDTKRIIRALEVFESTGQSISKLQKQRKGLNSEYEVKIVGLDIDRQQLYARIDSRVEKMFRKGLAAEARKLLKSKLSRTASYAIGVRELKGYFEGAYDLEEAKRLIKRNTRRYAKRQLTWFRKDKRIEWVAVGAAERPSSVARRLFSKI